jgi:non-heme chloroperoxidase
MNGAYSTCKVNGTSLAYTASGAGAPLVFVHGTLGSLNDFENHLAAFGPSYRAISYSRRYHPPNPVPPDAKEYAIAEHANDLREVISSQGETAHIVGSSYGGYVALTLALREPGLFRSLTLCEPPVLPLLRNTREGQKLFEAFVEQTVKPVRAAFRDDDPRRGVACFVDGVTGQRKVFDKLPPEVQDRLCDAAPALRLEFLTDLLQYMPGVSVDSLSLLRLPVLLLEGRLSPRFFHVIVDELARAIPGAQRRVIPRTGHTMHSGNPEEFNRVVREFLGSTETGRAVS